MFALTVKGLWTNKLRYAHRPRRRSRRGLHGRHDGADRHHGEDLRRGLHISQRRHRRHRAPRKPPSTASSPGSGPHRGRRRPAGCRRRRRRGGRGLDPTSPSSSRPTARRPRPTVSASRSGPTGSRTAPEPVRAVVRACAQGRQRGRARQEHGRGRGLGAGLDVKVLTKTGPTSLTLVGTASYGAIDGIPGSSLVATNDATAQRLFAEPGKYDNVLVAGFGGRDVELTKRHGSSPRSRHRRPASRRSPVSRTPPTSSPTSKTTSASSTSS